MKIYTEDDNIRMIEEINEALPFHLDYIPFVHRLVCEEGMSLYTDLLEALKYQEMADADPEASRRKGYYEEAARLRKAAIAKAENGGG